MYLNKKAQTWSFDVIIAITVFIIAFVVFYGVISYAGTKPPTEELVDEGNLILKTMSSTNEDSKAVIINNKINEENLEVFAKLGDDVGDSGGTEEEIERKKLEKIQEFLGTTDHFCVYLEDDEGNIIPIEYTDDDDKGIKKYGMGSSEIMIGGEACGADVNSP